MASDPTVRRLLEEILESGTSPDEVCRSCPELLPQVRERWQRLRSLETQIGMIFPESASPTIPNLSPPKQPPSALPQIPGYEVQEVLGYGGMGVVYKAWNKRLNRAVALKMMLAGAYARPGETKRFIRETESLAVLRHANIVDVYDVGDLDGRPYFTMEYLEGGSLAQKLANAPQPPHSAAAFVATLARAVQAAHERGIVHRDLKPANVLLMSDGTPKITDFGLARKLEGNGGITTNGLPMGTPNYMAPEQAQGRRDAIGPATDVYALGGILYEMLTGRPPFRAETSARTLQQVLMEEPVPPSRLNRKVPRDLETICLKCLHKDPARRYASAAALAEDLHRFEKGDAIQARPAPVRERLARWGRRHPVSVTLASIALLLAACGAAGWLWFDHRRAVNAMANANAIEEDLREAAKFGEASEFDKARTALASAEGRLGQGAPADLRQRVNQAPADLELAAQLDRIRLKRSTYVEGRYNHPAELRFNNSRAEREYAKAFREAGMSEPLSDPRSTAARFKAATMRASFVAALDDWAVCCSDKPRRNWLLSVTRLLDPDPWRDRVRDAAAWEDAAALASLAQTAPVGQRVQLPMMLVLAERLQLVRGDATALLQRIQAHYQDDFWTNFTLANALYGEGIQGKGDPAQAIAYFRKAIDLRPRTPAVYNNLGLVFFAKGWFDDKPDAWGEGALEAFRKALRIDPAFSPASSNLGLLLKNEGDWTNATRNYEDALRDDPESVSAHANLAEIRAGGGQFYDAIDHYQKAIQLDSSFAWAHYGLGLALEAKGYLDEANDCYPEGVKSLDQLRGAAFRESLARSKQAARLDPAWAPLPNMLQISSQDQARLNDAMAHFRQALQIEPQWAVVYGALGQAQLAQRDLHGAEASIRRSLDLLRGSESDLRGNVESDLRGNVESLLERCKHLLALESRLPAIVQGTEKPASSECLDLAELCFVKRHYAAASRFFALAFAATPELANDLRAGNRLNAACAAAMAGCGRGDDASRLGEAESRAFRDQARELLRRDLAAWADKLADGVPADPVRAQRMLASWRQNPYLAGLRDPQALNKLPPAERKPWQVLWQEVAEAEKSTANELAGAPSLPRLRDHIEGKWRHVVADTPQEIVLLHSGKINEETNRATWTLEGRTLRLTWPNDTAPGGAWVDTCRVSEDGNSYAGMNQGGADIRGTKIH